MFPFSPRVFLLLFKKKGLIDQSDALTSRDLINMAHHGHHSESASQIASVTAISEPAFPTVYRREKEEAAGELNVSRPDGSVSMFSTRAGETLLSQDRPRDKYDKLAPIPENRRLGYLSVAALIINKMIGMSSTSRAHTKLTPMIQQGLEYSRPPAQSLLVPAAAKAPHYYFGFLVQLAHWLGENFFRLWISNATDNQAGFYYF